MLLRSGACLTKYRDPCQELALFTATSKVLLLSTICDAILDTVIRPSSNHVFQILGYSGKMLCELTLYLTLWLTLWLAWIEYYYASSYAVGRV